MQQQDNLQPVDDNIPQLTPFLAKFYIARLGKRKNLQLICRRLGCLFYPRELKNCIEWRCSNTSAGGCQASFFTTLDKEKFTRSSTVKHTTSCLDAGVKTLGMLASSPLDQNSSSLEEVKMGCAKTKARQDGKVNSK